MHEERGHSLKGLQFFPAHNFFSKPKIQDTHCDLVAHAFQQIQFFDRVGNTTHTICQDRHTDAVISSPQRDANPISASAKLA